MDVCEHKRNVFFKDCSQDIPRDDILINLNALPNFLITGHYAFLTNEALENIGAKT